jgi:hypothetical protein
MKLILKAGTTGQVARVLIQDTSSTTGAGLTGLAYNSAGLKWSYVREDQAAATVVTLATATAGTWASGGFKEIDATNLPGVYEIGIPNAALASGKSVQMLLFGGLNMVPVPLEIELVAVDHQSASFGLSLAKTTNITGFNDIAATSIVTGGAITTSAGKVSGVALVDALTTYTGNTPQTGDAFSRLGTPSGASIAADIATRSTYAGADTSGTTTLLGRLSSARATNLDNLDAAVSTRLAGSAYTAPPATVTLATSQPNYAPAKAGDAMTLTGAYDAAKAAAQASQVPANFTSALFASSGVFAPAALANAPTGGGGGLNLAALQGELDARGLDATHTGRIDVSVSSVAATVTLDSGTVASGSSATAFTATGSGLSPASGGYAIGNRAVRFTSGPLKGEVATISGHSVSGSTHTFTLSESLTGTPSANQAFQVL